MKQVSIVDVVSGIVPRQICLEEFFWGAIMWRRSTGTAALASIAVGGITVVVLLFVKGMNSDAPIYGGLGLSLAVYRVLSLIARGDSVVEDSRVAGRT